MVLVQNNLLYFQVESGHAIYTANSTAAYNLIRTGKVLDMMSVAYGEAEKEVVQNLLSMGHAKVENLREAYSAKFKQAERLAAATNGTTNGHADHDEAENGDEMINKRTGLAVRSLEHLDEILCRLIQVDLVTSVSEGSFRSWEDTRNAVEEEVKRNFFVGGVRGTKGKEEFATKLSKSLRQVRDEPLNLKRKLQAKVQMNKRRKVSDWNSVNASFDDDSDLIIDVSICFRNCRVYFTDFPKGDVVLRINFEKCVVELRNQQLVHVVSEIYGDTTAEVYAILLQQISKKIARCRPDPEIDADEDDGFSTDIRVSTNEIFERLDPSLDVSGGIGKIAANLTDRKSANRIHDRPLGTKPLMEEAEVVGETSSDEEDAEETNGCGFDEDIRDQDHKEHTNGVNGTKGPKVKFNDNGPAKLSRKEHFRQHLLLLCEGQHQFLRHCAMEQWTVDFESLLQSLRVMELDNVIQRSVGLTGLRLVRILRRVGKMDEKTLPNLALMPKGDVQKLMLRMQMLGYADMQEVPRDNNRTASRTLFLYWTDTDRCMDRVLDNTYKTMVRCMQRLEVQRQMEADVLDLVKRDDVRGREKEMMQERYYNRFVRVTEIQERILAHVMRLDNLVGTIREF